MLKNQSFGYVMSLLRQFPSGVSAILFMMVIRGFGIAVLTPKITADLLNLVSQYRTTMDPFDLLGNKLISMVALTIFIRMSYKAWLYFYYVKSLPEMKEKINIDSMTKLLTKSNAYYAKYAPGFLISKISDLSQSVESLIDCLQNRVLSNLIVVTCVSISLYMIAPVFAIIMLVPFVLLLLFLAVYSSKLRVLENNSFEYNSRIFERITDVILNSLCIKLFIGHKEEKRGLSKAFVPAVQTEKDLMWVYLILFTGLDIFYIIVFTLQFYFLCKGLKSGNIGLGDFTFILFQGNIVSSNLWEIIVGIPESYKHYGRVNSSLQVITEECDLQDKPGAKNLVVEDGAIRFANVDFKYTDQSENLFNNLSIDIPAKQKVGLVGYSGSGKSSFVNLILRLYDVNSGSVTIDKVDIRDITQNSLHKSIALIPQSPMLFDRSILENIRYGRFDATKAEVIEAAKRASMHDFIDALPDKYESSANGLSGGQKQRIAIARAVLKNAHILVLDEATSQLDSITEREIQNSLSTIIDDKTTIIVAHRLSTLDKMDRILVFDKGYIVEDGTHKDLLNKNGKYAALWNAQANGLLPDKPVEQDTA